MNKKRLYKKIAVAFILMAMMLFALFLFYENQERISLANLYIEQQKIFSKISNNTIDYAPENSTCKISGDNKKKIILRLDDVKSGQYYDTTTKITNEILSRNMSISLGLIPRDLNKDIKFIYWINKVKKDPRVEIVLHGYTHGEQEFQNLTEEEAYDKLVKGKEILMKNINVVPTTFIPPENLYSEGTKTALVKAGFKIISAGNNEIDNYNNLTYLGYTVQTYDFENKLFISSDEVLKNCDVSLNEKDLCIITIHPQDYLEPDHGKINQERYSEFLNLLDGIEQRNIETKRFSDVINCSLEN